MQKRNTCTPFKSPFQAGGRSRSAGGVSGGVSGGVARVTAEELQQKLQQVNTEIEQLKAKGYRQDELKTHIDKMHEYNELKDIGQMVLGQLATVRGVRTQDLYAEYGLELDD